MILAINTANEKISIALYEKGKIEKELPWESYRTQSKELLPEIDKLMRENKIKLADIDAIAVNHGPGSYTGLRVGISIANTLGWSLDKPVVGVNSKNNAEDKMSALVIAKEAEEYLNKKKISKFQRIVIPRYNSKI